MALVRLEQLFPLPEAQLKEVIATYPNGARLMGAQEEPKNMGAWGYMLMNFDWVKLELASRNVYSAPAAGSSTRSKARHQKVIEKVFEQQ